MRLGLGMMRRGGSTAPLGARLAEDKAVRLPPVAGWEVTAGRWRHAGPAGWVVCAANEARSYHDAAGELLGYLMEGAETVHSAPWHDAAAPHGSGDACYLARTLAGDTVAYAGTHAGADIHGGTGQCVEVTQGAVGNGIVTANNVTCATTEGDVVRCEMLFSIADSAGTPGTISLRDTPRSGTAPWRFVTLAYDAAGTVTGWVSEPAAATYRAGWSAAGTRSDGAPVWFVWMEFAATGTATIAPALGLPTAVPGRKVLVHELRVLVNPQTAPRAVPVLAANKTFAADTIVTGLASPWGVLFHRLGRCRTRIEDGRLSVVDGAFRSGPAIPYESHVQLVTAEAGADVAGILPNATQDLDFTPWLSPVDFELILGPGYYNQRISVGTGADCTNMKLTSAFVSDPLLMAQVERIRTTRYYLPGDLTLDDMIVASRASEVTHQFEQIDIGSGTAALNNVDIGGSLYARRCLWASHPITHSRARAEAQGDDTGNRRVHIGANYLMTNGGNGVVCDLSGSHFWRMGRSFVFDAVSETAPVSVIADDCFHDQIWSDAWYWTSGTFTARFDRNLFGRFTAAPTDFCQSRKELEVDTGSGWQPLSGSGVALSSLPLGRKAVFAGMWDFASDTFTPAELSDRTLRIRSWTAGSGTLCDRPGFQWHASAAAYANEDRQIATGEVYLVSQDDPPSPQTPWARVTFDLGHWADVQTWVPGTNPALLASGTHTDTCQVNRTGCTIESMQASGCVLLGDVQGPFLTGNTALGPGDSDIRSAAFDNWIVVSPQSWAFAFEWSKTPGSTCTISDTLAVPMATRYRYANGTAPQLTIRASGANNTIGLTNVFMGHGDGPVPATGSAGGTLTGSPVRVDVPGIAGFAVSPPTGSPALGDLIAEPWLDTFTGRVRTDIDPLDPEFGFTPATDSLTGMALGTILANARGTHDRWNAVKARLNRLHFPPDHVVAVSAGAPVGTVLIEGLYAKGWMPLHSGNEKGHFAIADGRLSVARSLAGIDECWLLLTDDNRTILIDIG